MNCSECQDHLIAYAEGLLDARQQREVVSHLQACPACKADAAENAHLHGRLSACGKRLAQGSVETEVMGRIVREQDSKLRRIAMRKRYGKRGLGLATAAAIVIAVFAGWPGPSGVRVGAAEVLGQAIAALVDLQSVHIEARMRTLPRDNFELIGVDYGFVPIEMWKHFGETPQWRIEKPGRVVVMDGYSSLLLIEPNQAARGGVDTGFVSWLKPLLDVGRVLDGELCLAQEQGSELLLTHEEARDGSSKLVVTVEAKAQGDFTNDWCKNKSISASDNRRVYRFDARTKRLEDLMVCVHGDDECVIVLEIDEIMYNVQLDPSLFELTLPEDVIWLEEPDVVPGNEQYAQMSPDETALAFFQACADEDWDEVLKFWATSSVDPKLKEHAAGLEIIHIGKPFKSGQYPGWFVPYEIKLPSGYVKKHNLTVRNDNPAGRYVIDGGI